MRGHVRRGGEAPKKVSPGSSELSLASLFMDVDPAVGRFQKRVCLAKSGTRQRWVPWRPRRRRCTSVERATSLGESPGVLAQTPELMRRIPKLCAMARTGKTLKLPGGQLYIVELSRAP